VITVIIALTLLGSIPILPERIISARYFVFAVWNSHLLMSTYKLALISWSKASNLYDIYCNYLGTNEDIMDVDCSTVVGQVIKNILNIVLNVAKAPSRLKGITWVS
jgi:hypothetical protein